MEHKKIYHAISKRSLEVFNEELKKYTDEEYFPIGSISVCACYESGYSFSIYSILLCKIAEIKK